MHYDFFLESGAPLNKILVVKTRLTNGLWQNGLFRMANKYIYNICQYS